jgi:hypothetical protein
VEALDVVRDHRRLGRGVDRTLARSDPMQHLLGRQEDEAEGRRHPCFA